MENKPAAVVFDVLGTLFSLASLRPRLKAAGLPEEALDLWFATFQRDGASLAAMGDHRSFREVAESALVGLIERRGGPVDRAAVDAALDGFRALEPHPDVPYAFAELRKQRVRIAFLTNGTADNTAAVLDRAGLGAYVERVISIEEVQRWKPHPRTYAHAAEVLGLPPRGIAFVAAHAWDVHGAQQAGMVGAFVRRAIPWASSMGLPDVQGESLPEVCALLLRGARLERRAA